MKKPTALLLAITLILSLFGCAAEAEEENSWAKFEKTQAEREETFVAYGKDAEEMEDPLVICMDVEFAQTSAHDPDTVLNDFLLSLEQTGGLSNVQILYVPKEGAERKSKLDRLRIEIMAGGGPDVFIMNCATGGIPTADISVEEPLFRFPEMAMENGFFLPLDSYMENNTRFTEWDKLTQPVLAAGRHEEDGQVIVPVAYTLPVLVYQKSDLDVDLTDACYTWDDMLNNPEIAPFASRLADCSDPYFSDGMENPTVSARGNYFPHILGQVADFEEEELTVTEEELLEYINFILDNAEAIDPETEPPLSYSSMLGNFTFLSYTSELKRNINDGMTMIPMYTEDGGVSAMITSWAAVNRNTDKPEEAYTVIDMLLSENMQKNNWVYTYFMFLGDGMPMNEDLLHPDHSPSRYNMGLNETNYEELCELRSQITEAQFRNPVVAKLYFLVPHCYFGQRGILAGPAFEGFTTVEEEVHESFETMQRMIRE